MRVGRHIPPLPENVDNFLARFDKAYQPSGLSKTQQIISIAASHHRYLWIHPYFDGNGRVARLMSYAALLNIEIGSNLWSVARGLARQNQQYKSLLQAADENRHGDLDAHGNLSQQALIQYGFFSNPVVVKVFMTATK